jgi:hypothetical protein
MHEAYDFALQIVQEAAGFGYELLSDGTRLYGRVPHVAPLAWLHNVYAPLSQGGIERLERELAGPIPEVYRSWLRLANGFSAFSGYLEFDGLRTDYSRRIGVWQPFSLALPNTRQRLPDAPVEAFFIGSILDAECFLYLMPSSGAVQACGRRSATPLGSWESLSIFITSCMACLRAAFDAQGRRNRIVDLAELVRAGQRN